MAKAKPNLFSTLNSEKKGTTAEEVVVRLRDMIHRGEISAGDRLPPERDLAKLLGVSRPTLYGLLESHGISAARNGADAPPSPASVDAV